MSTLEISAPLSANTQAILLLTAPLIVGRGENSKELLTPSDQPDAALESLKKKGALTWPNPTTPEEFREAIAAQNGSSDTDQLSFL